MANTWEIKAAGPTNATGAFVGHGTDGVSYILAYSPPGAGTVLHTFPDPLEIYLDGSATPTLADDLPASFVPHDAYTYNAGFTVIGNINPSDTIRHEFTPLGIDWLQDTYSGASATPQNYTGMTLAALLSCAGEAILVTGDSPSGANGQVLTYTGHKITGTYEAPIPSNLSPIINAGQDKEVTPPIPSTVEVEATFANAPPSGATITYLWEFVSGPAGASPPTIVSPTNLTTDITFSEQIIGTYVFRISSSGDPAYGVPASSDLISIIIPVPRSPRIEVIRRTVSP